jgi:chromosome partitioning protein
LATALAQAGQAVLVIDLDPQGNASTGLGIDRRDRRSGTYAMLVEDTPPRNLILPTQVQNLDIVPADPDLKGSSACGWPCNYYRGAVTRTLSSIARQASACSP